MVGGEMGTRWSGKEIKYNISKRFKKYIIIGGKS
jgi:hypothetical protein